MWAHCQASEIRRAINEKLGQLEGSMEGGGCYDHYFKKCENTKKISKNKVLPKTTLI